MQSTKILVALLLAVLVIVVLQAVGSGAADRSVETVASVLAVGLLVLALGVLIRQSQRLQRIAEHAERREVEARPTGDDTAPLGETIPRLEVAVDRLDEGAEQLAQEVEEREREILRLTSNDLLTGLPNRSLFRELVSREIAHARRSSQPVGILVFDLDNFGSINARLGDASGDALLTAVAERVQRFMRSSDTVARLAGDEFGLLLARADSTQHLLDAGERILSMFSSPFELAGGEFSLSASAALSTFPEHGEGPDELLRAAESAMRRAKSKASRRLEVADRERDAGDPLNVDLEQELRRALPSGQLETYLQPQVDLVDGRIVGAEALVRWHHPDKGIMTAGQFVPLAETSGLMPEIGEWLLEEMCRRTKTWRAADLARVPLSVNVSVYQFEDGDLAEVIGQILTETEVPPDLLQIEITESLALHDVQRMKGELTRVRDLGVGLQLDDFGRGYSSLTYLLLYPVSGVKIDRAFVSSAPQSAHSAAIVRATLALADSLELDVVAEGVETAEQLAFLRDHGCQVAQGFLLGRPVPVGEFERLLEAGRVELPEA